MWERVFDAGFSDVGCCDPYHYGDVCSEQRVISIKRFIRSLLTTREAEVVERVKKTSYELVKEFHDNLITIAIENEHLRGCVTSNQIIKAFSDFEATVHPALTEKHKTPSYETKWKPSGSLRFY